MSDRQRSSTGAALGAVHTDRCCATCEGQIVENTETCRKRTFEVILAILFDTILKPHKSCFASNLLSSTGL